METRIIAKLEELQMVVQDVLAQLAGTSTKAAVVLALHGDLGVGKTTFVQILAAELGVQEVVTSPTFVIQKIYELNHAAWDALVHIDAYRLEEAKELAVLGWEETVTQARTLICVEWAERIDEVLPLDRTWHISLTIQPGDIRQLTITAPLSS